MTRVVIEGGSVVCVNGAEPGLDAEDSAQSSAGTEFSDGHVVIEHGRILSVGPGSAPPQDVPVDRIDASGRVVTPGLINTHDHLYQWTTRGMAPDAALFGWLSRLYPVWAGIDEDIEHGAASAGLAWAALSGCTTTADHHYVFPRGGGDIFGALVEASARIGTRLHAVRGSMDRGRSAGGLPPDSLVEDREAALAGTTEAIDRFHDPAADARVRVAVGPCSPFSVSEELLRESATLARSHGVRLHTHLAETSDEHQQCLREFGRTPVEHVESTGWLGSDVWLAHTVHLDDDGIARLKRAGSGVAHCPSSNGRLGAGVAPLRPLLDAGVPVGLGVDGAASNEAGGLDNELRQALLTCRSRYGPDKLAVRGALWTATRGGARCLGREDELGSVEPGKLADLAIWRLDGLAHAGIADPVTALVLGPRPTLDRLLCGGQTVVNNGRLNTASEDELTRDLRRVCRRILDREVTP